MCQSPLTITKKDGLTAKVSCGQCWQCKDNRVKDLVGRCIAENRYSRETSVVTLTYGTDRTVGTGKTTTLSASVLTYSDVQKYFKRLRNDGYEFRYVLCGEYGKLKGRCHWHVIFFWLSEPPPHPIMNPDGGSIWWDDPYWTKHPDSAGGFTHWSMFTFKSARYVCKYLLKDENDPSGQSLVRWSKGRKGSGGLLGSPFFRDLAGRYVQHQLPLQGRRYSFSDYLDPETGKPREFYMNDATLDYFCAEYVAQWIEAYGEHPEARMHSETLDFYLNRIARRLSSDDVERRRYRRAPKGLPVDMETGEIWPVRFDEKLNSFVAELGDRRMFWSKDEWGNPAWREDIVSSAGSANPSTGSAGSHKEGSPSVQELPLTKERYMRASKGA